MMTRTKAKNHPRQVAARGPVDEVDDRWTPQELFDSLHAEHGFTVDVAASRNNAKCDRFYTRFNDGLTKSWRDEVVWCNPPYSALYVWTLKARWEVAHGGCRKVVMLVPATRTEQPWWQTFVEPVRDRDEGIEVRFIEGRTKFFDPTNELAKAPPFGCAVIIITPSSKRSRRR